MEAHDDSDPVISPSWLAYPIASSLSCLFSLWTPSLISPFRPLLPPPGLPPVRHGFPPAGDVLLPEPRRGDRVCGQLPAAALRGADSGQRGSQPFILRFATSAQAERIPEAGPVPAAEARVLLPDPLHHQRLRHAGMRR